MNKVEFVAMDPLASIFPANIYATIIVNMLHPHEPSVAAIQKVASKMTKEEKSAAVERAQMMIAYAKVVVEALSTPG